MKMLNITIVYHIQTLKNAIKEQLEDGGGTEGVKIQNFCFRVSKAIHAWRPFNLYSSYCETSFETNNEQIVIFYIQHFD